MSKCISSILLWFLLHTCYLGCRTIRQKNKGFLEVFFSCLKKEISVKAHNIAHSEEIQDCEGN